MLIICLYEYFNKKITTQKIKRKTQKFEKSKITKETKQTKRGTFS